MSPPLCLNEIQHKNFSLLMNRLQYASKHLTEQVKDEGVVPSGNLLDILCFPNLKELGNSGIRDTEALKTLLLGIRQDSLKRMGGPSPLDRQPREEKIADVPYRAAMQVIKSISNMEYELSAENANYLAFLFIGAAHHRPKDLPVFVSKFLSLPEKNLSNGRKAVNAVTPNYDTILQPQSFDVHLVKPQIEMHEKDVKTARSKYYGSMFGQAYLTTALSALGINTTLLIDVVAGGKVEMPHVVVGSIISVTLGATVGYLTSTGDRKQQKENMETGREQITSFTALLENPPKDAGVAKGRSG